MKRSKIVLHFLLPLFLLGVASCKKEEPPPPPPPPPVVVKTELQKKIDSYNLDTKGLKNYFSPAGYFDMGVAIAPSTIDNLKKANLIKRHFNSLTAENAMKWSSLQPIEGTFTYSDADKIVTFAQTNGMRVRGHTLCWHNQVPAWVFKDGEATASKELVLQRLRTHITAVMTHFKGKVYAWDVVNEAIDDGGSIYKSTQWYNICGEDFIFEAFKAARAADPDVKLFYNDYSEVNPAKRDKIYNLAVKLKEQNLIDGVGLQSHWNVDYPSASLLNDALNKYKLLGLEIQITELDVSVYPSNSDPYSPYTQVFEQKQVAAYHRYFEKFRTFKDDITSVTFWNLADDASWLDNFPVSGRKNYPLLFDVNLNPKAAYFDIIDF